MRLANTCECAGLMPWISE